MSDMNIGNRIVLFVVLQAALILVMIAPYYAGLEH
jgi:hypothetical protein